MKKKVAAVLQLRFGAGGFDMKVLELQPTKRVLWQVVDGPLPQQLFEPRSTP